MRHHLRFSESDLRFLVETVATKRQDHDHVIDLIRDKDDLIEPMLQDPKLVDRLLQDEHAFTQVSPYLFFGALLRRLRGDLAQRSYVYEVGSGGKRLPVFEAPESVALLSEDSVIQYLTEMLCSFIRTNTGVVYWKERGAWHRRKFSDIDLDDMIALARVVDPELKPRYIRRGADLALFWSGIFPDLAAGRPARTQIMARRTLEDYERDGKRLYQLAAEESTVGDLQSVLNRLAEKFAVARRALNTLSDQFLHSRRAQLFG